MTFLYILYGFLAIVVIILVIALYLPNRYFYEKTVIIKKPCDIVVNQVANLHHYAEWNPWQQQHKNIQKEITGTPKTRGHCYAWEGKKVGKGSITIRDIDNKHVFFQLEFIKPYKAQARDNWVFEEWGHGETKVTWQNFGDLSYPMGRIMGYIMNKPLDRQFNRGLKNLKTRCEQLTT
jgi:Polyketide cyclase / dehydrase and lipid transport.